MVSRGAERGVSARRKSYRCELLGLTALVVVVMQIISLVATVGPLATLRSSTDQPDGPSSSVVVSRLKSVIREGCASGEAR